MLGTGDEAYKRIQRPLIMFNLVATTDGNAAGTTVVAAGIIGKDAVVFNSCNVIITSGDYRGFNAPVVGYDTTTGTLTLGDPMGAAIEAGIRFAVLASESFSVSVTLTDTLVHVGKCSAGMTGSTTSIVCPDLVGHGNDDFNTGYVMIILLNDNSHGAAPEGEMRDITDYVSSTGTFTVVAFSANVEASDEVMILKTEVADQRIAQGQFYKSKVNGDAAGSTTVHPIAELTNFGDDFFNTDWLMIVLKNANGVGTAPEGQRRGITDYVSATGVITTTAFTGAVQADDDVLIVRKEFIATVIAQGGFYFGAVDAGAAGSTTAHPIADLAGFGDDFFNSDYYMVLLLNDDSHGAAPEREIRDITDYVSATGTFTTLAFTANVETLDKVLIIRQSLILPELTEGMVYSSPVDQNAGGSTTVHPIGNLAGYGDDFFNTDYVMVVLYNANAVGAAPEGEARDITDYATATGTFTTVAFSATVEATDIVIVAKREWFLIDAVPLKTTPVTNSLAYRISQYIATGDGDFAGGTILPSNISLYDILAGANGIPVGWPAPAVPAADVSIAEVVNYLFANQLRAALGTVAGGGTGWEEDGTGLSLYEALAGVVEDTGAAGWLSGAAHESLADMPEMTAVLQGMPSPHVDQDSIRVAQLSVENLRTDATLAPVGERAGTVISIERYRIGVDADWNAIATPGVIEAAGYDWCAYTFPAASWQNGDLIRYRAHSCVFTIGAATRQTFYVPELVVYGVVGGIAAIMAKLDLLQEVIWMADYDKFDVADATPVSSVRWEGENYVDDLEDSDASIAAGVATVLADPDVGTPTSTGYWLRHKPRRQSRHFTAIVDLDSTLVENTGETLAGLMLTKGVAYDVDNYLYVARRKNLTGSVDDVVSDGVIGTAAQTESTVAITADAVALRIDRNGNIIRLYVSLTQAPTYEWILVGEFQDAANAFGGDTSIALFAHSAAADADHTAQGVFDNFKYYVNTSGLVEIMAGDYDSAHVVADRDGSLVERLEYITEEQIGNEFDGSPDLYDTVVSGYDATALAGNAKGSILEALQVLQGLVYVGFCDAGMGASQTIISCGGIMGYGADYFNTDYAMVIIRNDNAHGVAPEGEARDITDYTDAGVFTTVAFSANVEAADIIMVIRRELLLADAAALKTTPITNSLAYRVSQYLADGDGDFATGTVLPSNASLYDTLGAPQHFTASASAVNSLTAAALVDVASAYIGQIVVPLSGNMAGQGRYIIGYDGTQTITVLPAWPADPGAVDFIIIPSNLGRILLALGVEYTTSLDLYDTIVTGYTTAVTAVVQGSLLERIEVLQDRLITGNVIYTATGSSTTTLVVAGLLDVASNYIGQMAIPLAGNMAGQGRYISAYDGTQTITVTPAWAEDPGSVDFMIAPSESSIVYDALAGANGILAWPGAAIPGANVSMSEVLQYVYSEQFGTEFDGSPDLYDVLVTGWTGAATATAVGALIERLQLLQETLINANTIFVTSAATVNTVTSAALVDRDDLYVGMMIVPLDGNQAGQGRYITAYDDTSILTVSPDWSTDPDAGGAFNFVVVPSPVRFAYEAGKGLSAIYDLVNGLPVLTRIYSDYDIGVLTVEETVFEYDDAAYVWHPHWLSFHLDELAAAEQLEVKVYVKDNDTDNNERLMMHLDYLGVQAVPVKFVELPPVDLYFKVTVEQTGGALRDVIFKLFKES